MERRSAHAGRIRQFLHTQLSGVLGVHALQSAIHLPEAAVQCRRRAKGAALLAAKHR